MSKTIHTPSIWRDEFAALAEPHHPSAKRLLAFWENRPADGLVVGRDFPSRVIADLLSYLTLWEPTQAGSDFRVRLAGAAVCRRFGRDVKGALFSELFSADDFRHHFEETRELMQTGKAKVVESRLFDGNVQRLHQEVVILPVLAPNRIDQWVVVGIFYFD
jgi:hypothetical protein